MDAQLQELLDKKACEELVMRYGRTQDWLDAKGLSSCFWADADIDFGFFKGKGSDWTTAVMQIEQAAIHRWHMCTSVLIQVDGSKASGECYGIAVSSNETEDGLRMDTIFGGRYLDEFEKRDDEWRISKRSYILDWTNQFPNGLEAAAGGDFLLNILNIRESGHPMYRPL